MNLSRCLQIAATAVLLCIIVPSEAELLQNNVSLRTLNDSEKIHHYHVFVFDWERVRIPLTIALWIAFAVIAKIGFHISQRVVNIFPDSALLIVLGLVVGASLPLLGRLPGIPRLIRGISLEPTLFFTYLLPPIVFDAGYFMPGRAFVGNLPTILTFAVINTLWSVGVVGAGLWTIGWLVGGFSHSATVLELLLFATIVSAVDPVAVLVVFEEVHVNQLLYITVFGESLLNDAVTVVLYKMLDTFALIGQENLLPSDLLSGFLSFFVVALGGVLIGLIWAIITSLTTKFTEHLIVVQPLICLLFPYIAYLCATMFHMSEILAIVFCGLFMKQYVKANISPESAATVKYSLRTLTSCSETIIFVFLGLSTVYTVHHFDWFFTLCTIVLCLVSRFLGIFGLCAVVNRFREIDLTCRDQFIIAYGGLRGAITFGLVASLRDDIVAKKMFVTSAIVVILFTVFVLGVSVKPLVNYLNVSRTSGHQVNLSEHIFLEVIGRSMGAIEEITGIHGMYFLHENYQRFNGRFLRPWLTRGQTSKNMAAGELLDKLRQLNLEAALAYLKEKGGFPSPARRRLLSRIGEEKGYGSTLKPPSVTPMKTGERRKMTVA